MPGNGLWKKTEVERCGLLVLYVEAQIKTGCIKMGVVNDILIDYILIFVKNYGELSSDNAVIPAASSKASSLACVSGSTVLKSTPSVALDKSNSDAVFIMGLSRSSWSRMNDSTWERQVRVSNKIFSPLKASLWYHLDCRPLIKEYQIYIRLVFIKIQKGKRKIRNYTTENIIYITLYKKRPYAYKCTTYKKTRHVALVYLWFLSTEGKQKGAQG